MFKRSFYPLLLTILFTSVFEVSVIFFTRGEFLTFSTPLKTLAKKFDQPIPIIAITITAIKNIIIMVLNNSSLLYRKTAIKSNG